MEGWGLEKLAIQHWWHRIEALKVGEVALAAPDPTIESDASSIISSGKFHKLCPETTKAVKSQSFQPC